MNQNQNRSKDTEKEELFITRIFDTPRELVWKAWTEPATLTSTPSVASGAGRLLSIHVFPDMRS
jgi:hypothetical protein